MPELREDTAYERDRVDPLTMLNVPLQLSRSCSVHAPAEIVNTSVRARHQGIVDDEIVRWIAPDGCRHLAGKLARGEVGAQ